MRRDDALLRGIEMRSISNLIKSFNQILVSKESTMNILTTALRELPEYRSLTEGLSTPQASAVTGLSSIHRAHMGGHRTSGPGGLPGRAGRHADDLRALRLFAGNAGAVPRTGAGPAGCGLRVPGLGA